MATRQVLKISEHSFSQGRLPRPKSYTLVLVLLLIQCVTYGLSQAAVLGDHQSRPFYSTYSSKESAEDDALNQLLDELEKGKIFSGSHQLQYDGPVSVGEYQADDETATDSDYSTLSYLDYFLSQTDSPKLRLDLSRIQSDSRWTPAIAEPQVDQRVNSYAADRLDNQLPTDLLSYLADQAKTAETDFVESSKNFYQLDEEASNQKKSSAPFTTLIDEEPKTTRDDAAPVSTVAVPRMAEAKLTHNTTTNTTSKDSPESEPEGTSQPKPTMEPPQAEVSKWSITSLLEGLKNFLNSNLNWTAKPIEANSSKVNLSTNVEETSTISPLLRLGPTKPSSISVPDKKVQPKNNNNKVEEGTSTEESELASLIGDRVAGGRQLLTSPLINDGAHQVRLVKANKEDLAAPHQQVSATSPNGLPRVSLLRQPSLTPPFYLDEQMVAHPSTPQLHTLSTQFVDIEPTRHYRISSTSSRALRQHDGSYDNSVDTDVDDMKTMFADETSHHDAYLSRLRAGDHIFGPYRSYYDHRHPDAHGNLNLVAKESNDIYFLVMVVAFCAMAIAVVLSAGLFTYRIQQNRKTSSDQDYPTYGVVGPNNMTGKCGPAAFVGGYFGNSNGTVGASVSSSKATKGLPEYGDSGTDVSGSRTASMKSATNQGTGVANSMNVTTNNRSVSGFMLDNQSAARMYHYQHQKQQMIISDKNSAGRHTSASDLDSEDENDDGSYTVYECPGLASAHDMEIKNPLFNDDQTP